MQKILANTFILIIILSAFSMAFSQNQPVNPDSALEKILDTMPGTPLSLDKALQEGLKNSTEVRQAKALFNAARALVRREKGYFDPEFYFNYQYQDQQEPTASFFAGAPILATTNVTSRTGLRMDLPIGTQLEASLNVIKLKTNSSFAFLNPQYTAFGNISLRQPLLGGFQTSARRDLTKAEQDLKAAKARYDQQVLVVSAEIERRYWDLYAAERNYAVRQLTRKQGLAFLHDAELRAKAGLIGPSQVANAQTFLAEQNLLLLSEEEGLDQLSDHLVTLIGIQPSIGSPRFITIDNPPDEFTTQPLETLIENALANNSDLRAAKSDIESSKTLAKAAGWDALPQVDLIGSLGGNGLAGTGQNVIFGGDTLHTLRAGDMSDAISQVGKRDFKTWAVGVEVSVPIGFRSGRGEKQRLQAMVINAQQNYEHQARSLKERVRTSYRELNNGKPRIQAALDGVAAAQKQVEIGMIEFHNGRTTAFELVRLSADFALAQQRYSEALTKTAKAAVTLKELTAGKYTGPYYN